MKMENKTKAELIEIINQKTKELFDLKNDLRLLEKCKRYDDVTDEITDVYDKLVNKGFAGNDALKIVQTLISAGQIPTGGASRIKYHSYY